MAIAEEFQDQLRLAAAGLAIPDMPGERDFPSLVRDLPVFDPGTVSIHALQSPFFRLFGRKFAKDQLAARIRKWYGEQFKAAPTRLVAGIPRVIPTRLTCYSCASSSRTMPSG